MVGEIIGLGFLLMFFLIIFGAGIGEFLSGWHERKLQHEKEMAKLTAQKRKK